MKTPTANLVICGAGLLGASAAYHLAKAGFKDILLVDERPALSLTSDRSTECYRNWWPDADMLALVNRSIDLMETLVEESGNAFHMNRRGYLYVTSDPGRIPALRERLTRISGLGAGPARIHTPTDSTYQPAHPSDWRSAPPGADLLIGPELIRKHFPYLSEEVAAALHTRRAGWLSAHELGMTLLGQARQLGVRFESGRVSGVEVEQGRVRGIRLGDGSRVASPIFVNAAGPHLKEVGAMLGVDIPVFTELHLKMMIKDPLEAVGRDAPLLIWDDEQFLPWSEDERAALADDSATRWLTEKFPSGAHMRPEGGEGSQVLVMLWEYKTRLTPPIEPPSMDEDFPEVTLRGLARMVPRLRGYFGRIPRPQMDGGYYTKTRDNKPLVGALGVEGAFVAGAISGYGIMSGCAVGELLAAHVTGAGLPPFASAFLPERFSNAAYLKSLDMQTESGQL